MIYTAIALFAIAAILGLTILIKWLTQKEASRPVIYAHGTVAALALVLLVVCALQNPAGFPKTAIILFVVAALGGFYMFARDMKGKSRPLPVAFIHALVAISGFVALLIFVFA